MLLELSDELERNLYIEAIVKDYRNSGISVENLKKRVGALAMKGTPAEHRIQPKPVGAGQQKKKESAAEKAQKLMLTWLVTYPGIFDTVENISSLRFRGSSVQAGGRDALPAAQGMAM